MLVLNMAVWFFINLNLLRRLKTATYWSILISLLFIGYNYKSPDNSIWPKFVNRNNSVIFIKEIKKIRHKKNLWIKNKYRDLVQMLQI